MKRNKNIARSFREALDYLNNLEYSKAKSKFSLIIAKTNNEIIIEECHFYRAISNFHLKRFHNKNGFFVDLKAVDHDHFKRSFLFLLNLYTGISYESAFISIENSFKKEPSKLSQYKNLLIHLPIEFQIIFKIRFN